jgi:flagellar biogenesis protein FliO
MQALTFVLAFVAVLALIGVAAWLVRRFAGNRLGTNTNRGRMPRLAVIDAAAVDGRRRLVLVRRDNIEHLLMIGGPSDIVVESNIVRATTARDQIPQRPAVAGAEPTPRIMPLPDAVGRGDSEGSRPDPFEQIEQQLPEPAAAPRQLRPSFADEVRRPAAAAAERRSDPLTGFAPEPLGGRPDLRSEPMPLRLPSRNEPMIPRAQRPIETPKPPPVRPERIAAPPPPPPPPPAPPPAQPSAEQNLAEMAQRLEAALRRPAGDAGEQQRIPAPSVVSEPPPVRTATPPPPRPEPSAAPPVATPSPKSGFENLEDEMASLLGRPKNPS